MTKILFIHSVTTTTIIQSHVASDQWPTRIQVTEKVGRVSAVDRCGLLQKLIMILGLGRTVCLVPDRKVCRVFAQNHFRTLPAPTTTTTTASAILWVSLEAGVPLDNQFRLWQKSPSTYSLLTTAGGLKAFTNHWFAEISSDNEWNLQAMGISLIEWSVSYFTLNGSPFKRGTTFFFFFAEFFVMQIPIHWWDFKILHSWAPLCRLRLSVCVCWMTGDLKVDWLLSQQPETDLKPHSREFLVTPPTCFINHQIQFMGFIITGGGWKS